MIIQQGLFRNQDVKKDGQKKVDNISSIRQHKKSSNWSLPEESGNHFSFLIPEKNSFKKVKFNLYLYSSCTQKKTTY